MDWLIDNFGKLLPIILVVIYFWLNAKKRGSADEESSAAQGDADQAERARKIQEEIRRRILERQRGNPPQPRVGPPVLVEEGLHQAQEKTVRRAENWAAEPTGEVHQRAVPQSDHAQMLKHQAELAERLEQARRLTQRHQAAMDRNREVSARTVGPMTNVPDWVQTKINPLRAKLLGDLAERRGLRRAIVLREVLDLPVGMRSGPGR